MVNKDKIRIYDLAKANVPAELDEAAKKKVQGELSKKIIEVAKRYGFAPKTASSSLDQAIANDILRDCNVDQIVAEISGNSPLTTMLAPKRKGLRIVRRLTTVTDEEGTETLQEVAPEPAKAAEVSGEEKNSDLESVTNDTVLSESITDGEHDQSVQIGNTVADEEIETVVETESLIVEELIEPEEKSAKDSKAEEVTVSASDFDSEDIELDDVEEFEEEYDTELDEEPVIETFDSTPKVPANSYNAQTKNPNSDIAKNFARDVAKSKQRMSVNNIGSVQDVKVKSLSLNPAENRQKDDQPFRVAAPTLRVQGKKGTGMAKKPLTPEQRAVKKVKPKKFRQQQDDSPKLINIPNAMTVRELAHKVNISETKIITYFFVKGIVKTVNDILEKDLIVEFLETQNYLVTTDSENNLDNKELKKTLKEDATEGNLMQRSPVIAIMGHVDHGKTTLLDTLRGFRKKVVESEHGGITQHISAYQVVSEDFEGVERKITVIDTPGHEAFGAMRQRGANITDLVVLVVAADDGVKPQTLESIKYIKEAKVPFVVAVNKIDKPEANPDKVLGQLAEHDIVVEAYGGNVVSANVSALKGEGISDLIEQIILVADAELSEKIRSNPERSAVGTIIEAKMSRNQGAVATVLVQNGTLMRGDIIAAGSSFGRVKSMTDEFNKRIDAAGPSVPVNVLGLNVVPKAGDTLQVYSTVQEAKQVADEFEAKEIEAKRFKGISAFASEIKEGQQKEFRIIIKADVQGSAEAIAQEVNKLSTEEVLVKPVLYESGSITANDVHMSAQTDALIAGFHVGTDSKTAKLAESLGVKIKSYEVIYKLIEDIGNAVLGLHEPEYEEEQIGVAEVRQLFTINKRNIAGSYVTNGEVIRSEKAKVIRDGAKIYEGKLDYLKRFKDDAKKVREGFECGISFERYNDLQEGDEIICYRMKEIKRTEL